MSSTRGAEVAEPARQVALLRAVNLGATRKLSMPDLRAALAGAGHEDVRTHLQSGNVVLRSSLPAARLERRLEQEIRAAFGFDVPVMVRTRPQLAAVVRFNPLGDVATNGSRYHITFLARPLGAAAARGLTEADVAPEQLVVKGREVYAWLPEGVHHSRATRLLTEKRLGVAGTMRNWNTVVRLLQMLDE
jgi:uncharacterized protein (DUF1697 family)